MNDSALFGGEIAGLPSRQMSSSSKNTYGRAPQNEGPNSQNFVGGAYAPAQFGEYVGWSKPVDLNNLSLEFKQPTFKSVFNTAESEPHTPIEQIPPPLGGLMGEFNTKHRFGSVSSIATTDDDEMGGNEMVFPWNNEQDKLVKNIYEDLISKPNLTPFSGRIPPSGMLHRVSKDTLRMAKHKNIYFPHSMDHVRQRVIYFCQEEPDERELMDKFRISQDYFSMPTSVSKADQQLHDEFDFMNENTTGVDCRSAEEKYGKRAAPSALAAPFKEPIPSLAAQGTMTEEDIVNIVAKRKRDSLRMKRGPHKHSLSLV